MAGPTGILEMRQRPYASHYSASVVDLHMAVTGLGLLYVAFVFTRWTLAVPEELLGAWQYWFRFLAFVLVLLFAVFQAVAYDAHLTMHQKAAERDEEADRPGEAPRPWRLIGMFVADMLSVGASAAMFATVSVTPLGDLANPAGEAVKEFTFGGARGVALLGLATLWSATTLAWYATDGGDRQSMGFYAGFFAFFGTAAVTFGVLLDQRPGLDRLIATLTLLLYAIFVAVLLLCRAPKVIRTAFGWQQDETGGAAGEAEVAEAQ